MGQVVFRPFQEIEVVEGRAVAVGEWIVERQTCKPLLKFKETHFITKHIIQYTHEHCQKSPGVGSK